MRYKAYALSGAVLAAAAIAVTPAMAQLNPDFTGKPTNMGSDQGAQQADQISNPSTLAGDNVQDSTGQTIGTVRSVATDSGGRASRVNISLTRSGTGEGRTVSIRASRLHFDPASNTLKSSFTLSQIQAMPSTESP